MARSIKTSPAALGSPAPLPDLFVDPLVQERTVFSADRTHRFTLFRHWGNPDDYVAGVCMNPSSASESEGDKTVDGMVLRARTIWGAGAYYQLNAMSIRGTDSTELGNAAITSLPENDEWIRRIVAKARFVVVGWGKPGLASGRGPIVEKILLNACDPKRIFCFGKNLDGSPVHPLYQKRAAPLIPYFNSLLQ